MDLLFNTNMPLLLFSHLCGTSVYTLGCYPGYLFMEEIIIHETSLVLINPYIECYVRTAKDYTVNWQTLNITGTECYKIEHMYLPKNEVLVCSLKKFSNFLEQDLLCTPHAWQFVASVGWKICNGLRVSKSHLTSLYWSFCAVSLKILKRGWLKKTTYVFSPLLGEAWTVCHTLLRNFTLHRPFWGKHFASEIGSAFYYLICEWHKSHSLKTSDVLKDPTCEHRQGKTQRYYVCSVTSMCSGKAGPCHSI